MRAIRVLAVVGVLLLGAGLVRGALVTLGVGDVGGWWFVVYVLGLVAIAIVVAYVQGRADGRMVEASDQRAARWARVVSSFAPEPPGAGRQDASLTGVVGSDPEVLLVPRVVHCEGEQCDVIGEQPLEPGWSRTRHGGHLCPGCTQVAA